MSVAAGSDEQARAAIAGVLDRTLVVEAAAGTGKTTELINRIIAVIAQGVAEMRGIVAVTFTEKAAGELRLRLRQRLEEERANAAGAIARRFERAVESLEEAHVSTIHGFCADILRERPVEAKVDPLFRVLTEGQANRLLSETFDVWFRASLEQPGEGVRRSLRRPGRWAGAQEDEGPVERLRRAVIELSQWRDHRQAWVRVPFDRQGRIGALVEVVHALADLTRQPSSARDNLFIDTAPVRTLSDAIRREDAGGAPRDDDGLEGQLVELARNRDWLRGRKGSGASFAPGIPRVRVLERRDALMVALSEFRLQADADLAAALHGELLVCLDRYERRKEEEGALDFLDLLVRARDLVRDDRSVREHFQRRFTRIFVDEFQDTDPIQAELLLLLAADRPDVTEWTAVVPVPGKLFVVGDPKQSIYRFRRADLAVYRRVCEQLARAGGLRLELRRSFRSRPAIQRFVNTAFETIMDGSVSREQAHYVPLESLDDDRGEQPAVVALPVPRPYGPRTVTAREIQRSLPDAVGAYVHWLVTESGWQVSERRSGRVERVAVQPRHVCILFRRFVSFGEDVTRPYLDALEARGIPHLLVGGRAFHGREEIDTLRAALMAVEWPDDQLSVFATLRGALFAIGDEELLEYHHLGGRFHPFARVPALPGRLEPIRESLLFLAELHRLRNRRPVAETITTLLSRTRAHVGFVLRPNGEQVLANVLHVAELARQYEAEGGMSFRGFVDSIRVEADQIRSTEAPILEEGSDGVRLMTVHKAKGLEFPVVILADITARLTPYEANRTVDTPHGLCALRLGGWAPHELLERQSDEQAREQAEGERVAYVAATRARDLLIVGAVGDGPWSESWVSPLHEALYPPMADRRTPQPAAQCPSFTSRDTVLSRPDGDPAGAATVAPGAYTLGRETAPYGVIWWSPEPRVLPLDAEPSFGLRREDLVVKDVAPAILQRYTADYRAWRERMEAAVERGRVPGYRVLTATEVAGDPGVVLPEADIRIEQLDVDARRPRGIRFGTLVHALLAELPLDRDSLTSPLRLAALTDACARRIGATPEEMHAAERTVAAALRHPIVVAAASAGDACYRETSLTLRLPSGALVEGTVDLAYRHGDSFVVVDFKTDQELGDAIDVHRRQLQIYVAAIQEATGVPARGVLLRV